MMTAYETSNYTPEQQAAADEAYLNWGGDMEKQPDGFVVPLEMVLNDQTKIVAAAFPEGKIDPTQYNSRNNTIEFDAERFNPEHDSNRWLIHEKTHAVLRAGGYEDDDQALSKYPSNFEEQGAYTTQFYYLILNYGVTREDIETNPDFSDIKNKMERYPVLERYWKTAMQEATKDSSYLTATQLAA
ncbi:MAG: hypothetical protein LBQ11_01810 [Candidatus Nomurabacteria bacterium]|jgi:hypothetical protein|nr:hypothetical protein [Candidatus Nomurabacteria bacterium]